MTIAIREVHSKNDLTSFVKLPFRLFKNDPYWTPPLLREEYAYFNPERHRKLQKYPNTLLLALNGNRVTGRIFGLINEKANSQKGQKYLRWTFFDCENDKETAHSLLGYVEKWGKDRGMEFVVGPRGFSDREPQGAVVEGFEERAAIGTHYNKPYLIDFITGFGYEKDVDWVSYKMEVPESLPEVYRSILQRTLKNSELTHLSFSKKSELKSYIIPVFRLFNETYQDLYSFSPMSKTEMQSLARKYLPVLDPRFVQVIKDRDRLIAFAIVMPDLTYGLRRARGRLFPLGAVHILRAKKTAKILQFLLVGIHKDYRGRGIFTLFAEHLKKVTHEAGMDWIDSHLELEDNWAIRKWMERLGGKVYRRHRAFIKPL